MKTPGTGLQFLAVLIGMIGFGTFLNGARYEYASDVGIGIIMLFIAYKLWTNGQKKSRAAQEGTSKSQ